MNRDGRYLAVLFLAFALSVVAYRDRIDGFFSPPLSESASVQLRPPYERAGLFPAYPVNLNMASAEELVMIPGIGKKTADAIVERRNRTGPFKSVDELSGIVRQGSRFEKMRSFLSVTNEKSGGPDRGDDDDR